MSQMIIELKKQNFKFSSAHFTIFSKNKAERLHGHNYTVGFRFYLDAKKIENGLAFDFNLVKPLILKSCMELDEFVLLAEKNPYLQIGISGSQVDVKFHNKDYSFPKSDVKILPTENISTEELAQWLCLDFLKKLAALKVKIALNQISVTVEESFGQSACYEHRLSKK